MEKFAKPLKATQADEAGIPSIRLISRSPVSAEITYAGFPDHKSIVVLGSMVEYMEFANRVMERASGEVPVRLAA